MQMKMKMMNRISRRREEKEDTRRNEGMPATKARL